ncbi:MAG: IS1 family transposase [Candidatus Electronema sp. VV]
MRRFFTLTTGKVARKYIPPSKHAIGKADTWRIERRNLNFRTHIKRLNRRTICFSKNEKIYDKFMIMSSACISIVIILRTVDIQKVPDQRI